MNKKAIFSLIFYIQFHLWYFVIHFKEKFTLLKSKPTQMIKDFF